MRPVGPGRHPRITVVLGLVPAHTLGATQAEDGAWVIVDPNTRVIPEIHLRFDCQDQVLNGKPYPPGPPQNYVARR